MLSRHAEAIYWLARYMERAENTARLADVTYRTLLETDDVSGEHPLSWKVPLDINFERFHFLGTKGHSIENEEQVLEFLSFEPENPASISHCIERARHNAWSIRDVISSEMVEELNKVHRWVQEAKTTGLLHDRPHEFFQEVKTRCHLFEGVSSNTMLRDEGWHFHQSGRWLERGVQTARILEVLWAMLSTGEQGQTSSDPHLWISVLKSVAAYEAYRRRQPAQVQARQVADLLILNGEFPRSVHTCSRYLVQASMAIAQATGGQGRSEADRLARRLAGQLSTSLVEEVLIGDPMKFLADCQDQLRRIHDAISATYFIY